MRGVIVGVDESDGSRRALRWGGTAARVTGEPLIAAQAWSYPSSAILPWSQSSLPTPEELDEGVRAQVEEIVADELGADPGIEVRPEAVRGPAATALIRRAAAVDPRMLVVGSRGLGGFSGLLLGSVSRQCLDHATCTVVVVPEAPEPEGPDGSLDTIVVGVDGSSGAQHALDWAVDLGRRTGSTVVVVHAFEPSQAEVAPGVAAELRERTDQEFHGTWCTTAAEAEVAHECILVDGDPHTTLMDVARERGAALVVVGSLGRGRFATILGSVASRLASDASLPVAVVPEGRQLPDPG